MGNFITVINIESRYLKGEERGNKKGINYAYKSSSPPS